jgi:hypothetical protein
LQGLFHQELNTNISRANDVAVEAVDTSKIDADIENAKRVIKNANDWISHLGWLFDDKSFQSTGKKDATDKLRMRTDRLVAGRRDGWENSPSQYAKEIAEIAWVKAYEEAKKQGVAESTLTRLRTDADTSYGKNLQAIQSAYDFWINTLNGMQQKLAELQAQREELLKPAATSTDNAPVEPNEQTVVADVNDNSSIIDEANNLDILQQKLDAVRSAVDAKTSAFENEAAVVNASVDSEIAKLNELSDKVTEVKSKMNFDGEFGAVTGAQTTGVADDKKNPLLANAFKGMDLKDFLKRNVNKDAIGQLEDEFYKLAQTFIDEDADAMHLQISNIADLIVENSKKFREQKEENPYDEVFKALNVVYVKEEHRGDKQSENEFVTLLNEIQINKAEALQNISDNDHQNDRQDRVCGKNK